MNKFRIARAGIDVNNGIGRVLGDTEKYEELLIKFLDDTHYEELLESIQAGKQTEAFAAAHALKGIAANMCFTKLLEALDPVVETLRAESLDVQEYLPAVEETYQKIIDAVSELKKDI